MTPPADLIPIDEAARILHREVKTVRRWAERGFAPTGVKLPTFRDRATKIRFFSRRDVERVVSSMFAPAA